MLLIVCHFYTTKLAIADQYIWVEYFYMWSEKAWPAIAKGGMRRMYTHAPNFYKIYTSQFLGYFPVPLMVYSQRAKAKTMVSYLDLILVMVTGHQRLPFPTDMKR